MSPGRHAAVSTLIAAGCAGTYGGWEPAAAAFVAGTAIDADHLLDYAWNGMGAFRPARFVRVCNEFRLRRFYLPAHALEWILPFLAWTWAAEAPAWVRAAGLGLGAHMVMDLLGNGMTLQSYFLSYRALHRFEPRKFLYMLPPSGLAYWGSFSAFLKGRPAGPSRQRVALA